MELIFIGRHQVVLEVPRRKRTCPAVIEWIDDIGDTRSLVDGLAEGVCQHQIQPLARVPEACLKGIIVRVTEAPFEIVVAEVLPEWPAGTVDHLPKSTYVSGILRKRPAC